MRRRIVLGMEPRQLLKALMKQAGDTPSSLARALKHEKATQPQIHKFAEGVVREPRRAMLAPIADHYGVPLDAFYDTDIAEQIAVQRGLEPGTGSQATAAVPKAKTGKAPRMGDSAPTALATSARWPFKAVSYQRFMALPAAARDEIGEHLALLVRQHEARQPADARQTAV